MPETEVRQSTDVAVRPPPRQVIIADDYVPILDTARFEHMQRIAQAMATGMLLPESIYKERRGENYIELPAPMIAARCFQIVNQAVRWGMDPFAVMQCTSVIAGKLCYEGKLVQGVIEAKARVIFEQPTYDDKPGDALGIEIIGTFPDGRKRTIEGTVGQWKTTRKGSPWHDPLNHKRMLRYRGMREWGRFYTPALLLGIYTDDELEELADDARSRREGRDIQITTPGIAARLPGKVNGSGFGGDVAKAMTDDGKAEEKKDAGEAKAVVQEADGAQETASEVSGHDAAVADAQGDLLNGKSDKAALKDDEKELLDKIAEELKTASKAAEVDAVIAAFKEDLDHSTESARVQAGALFDVALKVAKPKKSK